MTKSQETWDALRAENHALLGQVEKLTRARNVEIALIEDYGRVVAGLTAERDDLQLAFSRCNETKTALQMNLREAHKEREGIAAQNQALRDARVLRDAAEICDEENNNWAHNGASHAADVLRWKADKLEQKK